LPVKRGIAATSLKRSYSTWSTRWWLQEIDSLCWVIARLDDKSRVGSQLLLNKWH